MAANRQSIATAAISETPETTRLAPGASAKIHKPREAKATSDGQPPSATSTAGNDGPPAPQVSAKARGYREGENPPRCRGSQWLFPGATGGKLSGMAMSVLMRRMKVDATVHGFRSGFRDWAAECTGYAHEVAEMALAHTIENKVERAYRRGDLFEKRRRLMEDWTAYCASGGAAGHTVTPIRKAAQA